MASFKIDRVKKERRQSESERTEGLFQSIDWIVDKYPTIPIQPKTRVDDYSMIMQFPSKSLVTEEMYSYIQSALMINGWNISDWNENEVIVHDFFTMIDDGVPLPTNGRTPRYDEIGKSARLSERSFNDMVKSIRKGEHLEKDAHDFKVGDILISTWGYDQTNVQWYQVVGVTSKSVKIREIKGRVQETGFMSGEAIPIPDAFTNNLWFGEQKTARVNSYGEVNITSDGRITAWKWDGNPERVSWYA